MSNYPNTPGYELEETSIEAAQAIEHSADSLRAQVRQHIEELGDYGATCDEVEAALIMKHQTASARIRELFLHGQIEKTGDKRLTRSGRRANVYTVREK